MHTDRAYNEELVALRELILRMAGQVEAMIADAVTALITGDTALAARTIEVDRAVNSAELEVDEQCLVILAKRQPMASDLRFVTLILKMVTDLERIGDLAVNICERVQDLAGQAPLKPYDDIPTMAQLVQSMVNDAINAFMEEDASKAEAVICRDDEVDAYYSRMFRDLLDIMLKDPAAVERGIHVQSVAKWLERMADHATNLAEQVVFMVKGRDIRHAAPGERGRAALRVVR